MKSLGKNGGYLPPNMVCICTYGYVILHERAFFLMIVPMFGFTILSAPYIIHIFGAFKGAKQPTGVLASFHGAKLEWYVYF